MSCPVLDDPAAVDGATRIWEAVRDRDCLPAYHFANLDTRVERPSPALCELVRDAGRTTEPDLSDLFGRARTLQEIAPLPRLARALAAALWRGERSRAETLSPRRPRRAHGSRDPPRAPCRPLPRHAHDHRARTIPAPFGLRRRATRMPRAPAADPRRLPTVTSGGGPRMTRIAVVQPALALGEVEANLIRIEDLIRDAHREHNAEVVLVPEGCTSPNVYAKVLLGTARPIDGQPFQLLTRLARELDCVIGGGFVAVRGEHTYGTYVLAEPDGAAHLHDKDIPTAWEQNYYKGGDDDGVVRCETARSHRRPDVRVGMGAQPHVRPRACRRRAARAGRHVLAVDAHELARPAAPADPARARNLA